MSTLFPSEVMAHIRSSHPIFAGAHVLKVLDVLHAPRIDYFQKRRMDLLSTIKLVSALAEGGKVAVIESGRDCDGVEYSGSVHIIDASLAAVRALDDHIGEWADGPYRLRLERVSVARGIEYESRDLVMEARENGHHHSIVSQYP